MMKRFAAAAGVAAIVGTLLTSAVHAQVGQDPFSRILEKLDELLASVGGFSVDLRGVTQNWDKKLPADDPGGPCPSSSSRFTCVFDGAAVRDNETGLVWEQSPSTELHPWMSVSNVRDACANRNTGGRRGWRLPSITELGTLIDQTQSNPTLPAGHPFTNIQTGPKGYWSATSDADGGAAAWAVTFFSGFIGIGSKDVTSYAWCVRGPMNADRY